MFFKPYSRFSSGRQTQEKLTALIVKVIVVQLPIFISQPSDFHPNQNYNFEFRFGEKIEVCVNWFLTLSPHSYGNKFCYDIFGCNVFFANWAFLENILCQLGCMVFRHYKVIFATILRILRNWKQFWSRLSMNPVQKLASPWKMEKNNQYWQNDWSFG